MEHDLGYTMYWDSITVYYEVENTETPSEPNQPTGDMSIAGIVLALTAATGAVVVLAKKKEF